MQAMAISTTPAVWRVCTGKQGLPEPVRRPPGHPPQEPIIIKIPPRPPEAPEIDRSDDEEEEEAEIRRPPELSLNCRHLLGRRNGRCDPLNGSARPRSPLARFRLGGPRTVLQRTLALAQLSAGRSSWMPASRKPGEAT